MKKRILSLLLAVITILQVIPAFTLPTIAEDETTGIDVADMEVGKLYKAIFKSKEQSGWWDVILYNDEMYEYKSSVIKSTLPQDLTVKKVEDDDIVVYITNEVWASTEHGDLDDYRFIEAHELIILELIEEPDDGLIRGEVGLTIDGKTVTSLSIAEGEKTYVFTELSDKLDGDPTYRWELLIDRESNRWATVQDYVYPYAPISAALIANAGQENGAATLRCIAALDGKNYVSGELDISVDPSLPEPELPLIPTVQSGSLTPLGADAPTPRADDAFHIIIQYIYWTDSPLKEAGHGTTAMPTYTATVGEDLPLTASVPSLPVLGYTPYIRDDDAPEGTYREYAAREIPGDPDSPIETHRYVQADTIDFVHQTTGYQVTVYYLPNLVTFRVNHYIQNLRNDTYTLYHTDEGLQGYADYTVGEDRQLELEGFSNLFYDPNTRISASNNTTVDIYYDRNYYLVDFDLSGPNDSKGYGVMPLYVRYEASVQVGDPQNPGYTFNGWNLVNVYTDTDDPDGTEVPDQNTRNQYINPSNAMTIKHNLKYTSNWTVATAAYTVIYWRENADSTDASNRNNYSVWATETVTGATPGATLDCTGIDIPQNLANAVIDGKDTNEKPYVTRANAMSDQSVVIQGDNSTVVNIYYIRNTYHLWFYGISAKCALYEHSHNDGTCDRPLLCSKPIHEHTADCKQDGYDCGYEEHTHTVECCVYEVHSHNAVDCKCNIDTTHKHSLTCYTSQSLNQASSANGNAKNAYNQLQNQVPNPTNGYIYRYYYNNNTYNFFYFGSIWYYLGTGNDDDNIEHNVNTPSWWMTLYSGQAEFICGKSEHTHGDGNCVYTCSKVEHNHSSGCNYSKCGLTQHTHVDNCIHYSCEQKAHVHTDACYGSCTKYTHDHNNTCTQNSTNNNVWVISAKYGADISAVWPTAELVQREINANFRLLTWSKFANTSAALATKRVTMTADLCVNGTTPPRSSANAADRDTKYTIYYMFESFDQTSAASGNDRKQYNNKYYDSDIRYKQDLYQTNSLSAKQISGMSPVTTSSQSGTNNTMFLYYSRNRNRITFENLDEEIYTMTDIMFEQPLNAAFFNGRMASYTGKKEEWEFTDANGNKVKVMIPIPDTPSSYEEGSVVFAGWYTTPMCVDGTEYNFADGFMPDAEVTLFAKWEPTYWDIVVYQEKPLDADNPPTVLWEHYDVPFGTLPNTLDKEPDRVSPVEEYIFAGWYYEDEITGEEKRFDFNTMPIKQDYVIYAKWTSEVPVPFTVRYVIEQADGTEIEIAEPTKGQSLAGITKSFSAKVGKELYENYRTSYFPTTREQSWTMEHTSDDNHNVITFKYVTDDKIDYRIKHVFVSEDADFVRIVGGNTLTLVWESHVTGASSAKLEENFQGKINHSNVISKLTSMKYSSTDAATLWDKIKHMSPDYFNQSMILVANSTIDQNEIVFNWIGGSSVVIYEVHHMYQDVGSDDSYTRHGDPEVYNARYYLTDGKAPPVDMPKPQATAGYKYADRYKTNNKANDQDLTLILPTAEQEGLIIELYYDRETYDYSVKYVDENNIPIVVDPAVTPIVTGQGRYLDKLTVGTVVKDIHIPGYKLINGSDEVSLTYNNQVIECRYQKQSATYNYRVIGSGGQSAPLIERNIPFGEQPGGSQALPDAGWILKGWYYGDRFGNDLQAVSSVGATVVDGKLIPKVVSEEDVGKEFFFWAIFIPTTLTITNSVDAGTAIPEWVTENQGFIYKIEGKPDTATEGISLTVAVPVGKTQTVLGLPLGEYNITLEGDWSWRYKELTCNIGTISEDKQKMSFTFNGGETVSFTYNAPGNDTNNGYYITDGAYNDPTPKAEP